MPDHHDIHGRVRPLESGKIGVTFWETELCLTPAEWAPLASRILAACQPEGAGQGQGNQQSSEALQRVEGGRLPEGNQSERDVCDTNTFPAPAELAEMRARHAASIGGTWASDEETLTAEREALRTALVGVVNATDGYATPWVSTEFLCHAPGEVAAIKRQRDEARSTIARLTAELRELRLQYIADFGQAQERGQEEHWYADHRRLVEAEHAAEKEGME